MLKDLPAAMRPREKLLLQGPDSLSDAELAELELATDEALGRVLQTIAARGWSDDCRLDYVRVGGSARATVNQVVRRPAVGELPPLPSVKPSGRAR